MYIGHYAAAAALVTLVPESPVLPAAVGVAWPDLLWPALVIVGVERVTVSPTDPLQRAVRFDAYPFSHSLVLGNLIAILPAVVIGSAYQNVVAGLVFWLAALSHWVLDLVVHQPDLPVIGFGIGDHRLGAGLWRNPRFTFVAEYMFFAAVVVTTARPSMLVGVLGGGLLLHLFNANSAFAFTKRNPLDTPTRFALVTLVGYVAATAWFEMAWV
ncbi:hypothetical protein LLS1_31670 [Leifsonia sp. LS1]|uniref:hypothetical protein n=1 Tax=Leifsonia sp. LS1 TaxID=2828483 RepID=UPI001CFED883|nr:hypothetical protein [Leifsonia sp. LS1]GIT81498.1 hypothetical protein LLS1_31670 [Leifsonia sp. LS1]